MQPIQPSPELTPDQAFAAAVALHQKGRMSEAESGYRDVLSLDHAHFDARRHLGLLLTQRGRFADAVAQLEQAVVAKPDSIEALIDLGIALQRLRRFDEAAGIYERVLTLDPVNVGAHNNLGATLQALGRFAQAASEFETALRIRPGSAAVHNNLGIALSALGRTEQAVAAYEKAVAIDPRYTDARDNLGNALAALGRHNEALLCLYRALDLTPNAATTHNALAAALLAIKAFEEAGAHCRRAIEIDPDFAEAHNNLGLALVGLRRYDEAAAHCRRAIEIKPELAEAYNNLGNALAGLKLRDEAIDRYRRAIELKPDFFEAHNNLGNTLSALKRHTEAIPHFRKALAVKSDFAEALVNLGNALTAINQHGEAAANYERSLGISPALPEAHSGYGNHLMIAGRLEESRREIERAIALAPARPEFYRSLAAVKHFDADDPQLAAMQALARNRIGLTDDERMELHFALGKAEADVGLHESAFRHMVAANTIKRRQIDYSEKAALGLLEGIAAAFTPDEMHRLSGYGDLSSLPIFIIGMPRSGTTLVEQVLASHPSVFGAGEIGELEAVVGAPAGSLGGRRLLEKIVALTGEQVRRIGADYVSRITALAPAALRVSDKMLSNFHFVGLIHLALPNARIVHVRRDPADTCLSCFSKLFGGDLPFTYDLAELGRYYRAYAALMAHWRTVLPEGAMLEVQYEDLVADFPAQARRLVTYCGLAWDERCSAFHETRRPVSTSSATQVRQPLYTTSIGQWRAYEPWIGQLLQALGTDGDSKATR